MMSGWNRTIDPLGKSHEFFGHPSDQVWPAAAGTRAPWLNRAVLQGSFPGPTSLEDQTRIGGERDEPHRRNEEMAGRTDPAAGHRGLARCPSGSWPAIKHVALDLKSAEIREGGQPTVATERRCQAGATRQIGRCLPGELRLRFLSGMTQAPHPLLTLLQNSFP